MSSYLLIFSGIMSSLMFSSFGVKPPLLAFSLILIVASRFLHPDSTDDETYRLMVKKFSTVRDTQRVSELHGEEEREEGGRGDQEEQRSSQKGRNKSSQLSVPYVFSTPWNSRRDSQS